MIEFKYPDRERRIEAAKAAVVEQFQKRQSAREKARHLQRKAGVPVAPWSDLTWQRLHAIEASDPGVLEVLIRDEAFQKRRAELHQEREELEHALEVAEQDVVMAWIVNMPPAERKRRDRETWSATQLARFDAEDERDLERKNPDFFNRVYLPERDRMIAAEEAAAAEGDGA